MKIYKDWELSQPTEILDLGIVQVGDSKDYTFYIHNESNAEIRNLKVSLEHEEVEILESPTEIASTATKPLKIRWSPTLEIKAGLKTKVIFKAVELWS